MAKKQGIQGSYNNVSVNLVKEDRKFRQQWIHGMVRTLNYDPIERRRWKQVAERYLSAQ